MSEEAVFLRRNLVIKVIPMLNPDGVIAGNFRTGLAGNDLNRKFAEPNEKLHPTVFAMKKMVEELRAKKIKIWAYLDFHGHSTKKNVFIYAPEFPVHSPFYYAVKLLPKLISLRTDMFRFYSCIFRVSRGKMTTARAVFSMDYGIHNCFTIESSFASYVTSSKETKAFVSELFVNMGGHIAFGIYEYLKLLQEEEALRERRKLERMQKKKERQDKRLGGQQMKHAKQKPNELVTNNPSKVQNSRSEQNNLYSSSNSLQGEGKTSNLNAYQESANSKINKFPTDNSISLTDKEIVGAYPAINNLGKARSPSRVFGLSNKKTKVGISLKKKKSASKTKLDPEEAELGINKLKDVKNR